MADLNEKVVKATKWSTISELASKLLNPISNMILARLLTPDAYGVVATLTMIISFAEIFTDAGFQKYIIQHEFRDEVDIEQSTTVAFWSNLGISIFLWMLIFIFSDSLAFVVGNPGLGFVIVIACISIVINSFSSIQIALYKRKLDFKTLFKVRIVGICVPLFITIPLALWLHNYWALVIATIARNVIDAILLTYYSSWKPRFFYSIKRVKEMFSFTVWSMIEAVAIWFTSYVDIFIIGVCLTPYYLGIYKTSMNTVNLIISLVTSATIPILFSSLSRLQNDDNEFKTMFFKFQNIVGIFVIPLGVGIFCYSDLVTDILLGSQWADAAFFIGLWGLTSPFLIILSHFCSEVYRAKGRPKLSVVAQFLHLVILVPVILIASGYSFDILCLARSLVRFEGILVNLLFMSFIFKFSSLRMIKNIFPSMLSSCVILLISYISYFIGDSVYVRFIFALLSLMAYFGVIFIFHDERKNLLYFIDTKLKK